MTKKEKIKYIRDQSFEYNIRKKKLENLKKKGFNFPNIYSCKNSSKDIIKNYSFYTNEDLIEKKIQVNISGRIINKRILGKALFFVIQDFNDSIQIYIKSNDFKDKFYKNNILEIDLGDIVYISGFIFKTKTKELSIYCKKIDLLTKSVLPLPEKYHGLNNTELKYRQRYLDLISNKKTRNLFIKRSQIISNIRHFMEENNFLEVETPMMQSIPGGANAKPFFTHYNVLKKKMFLRVSPELYLKKLIVGGFKKIFEINKNFRNEGISCRHNPEFTMMEIYSAYSSYKYMIKFLIKLLKFLTKKIFGQYIIIYKKNTYDLNKKIETLTMTEAIIKYNQNIQKSDLKDIEKIKKIAKLLNLKINSNWSLGEIKGFLFEKTTEKKLIKPTFITHYPIEISPLAKKYEGTSKSAERFEFFMSGYEIANGFSELNDAEEQKKRFLSQNKQNKETFNNYSYDKDYITALRYGLPPTSGLGIGIDRLIMLLTDQKNIRDVILFPTLKDIKK